MTQTPAAQLIGQLQAAGWSYAQIGKALNVNPSLVRQGINPSPGQRQKPLTKYVPALQGLQSKQPGAAAAKLPAKRTTKAGKVAKVRTSTRQITTKKGITHTITQVKKGPATLRNAIKDAAAKGKRIRWNVNFKKIKTKSDMRKFDAWASAHLPSGWSAQTLLDRIDNPQESDDWKAGDVNAALAAIVREQNEGGIVSATGAQEFNLFTADEAEEPDK